MSRTFSKVPSGRNSHDRESAPHGNVHLQPPIHTHIEGLQKGSYRDFKALYEMFSGKLYGFVFGLTKSESLTKDIVQETFVRIWTGRQAIDPQQSFKSYLFKIARNLIVDSLRKQMNDPVFEDYLDYAENLALSHNGEDVYRKIDFDRFIRCLDKAKQALSPRQKELFELNKEQGVAAPEIARKLNISEQTVYNQLSAALKTLKQAIGADNGHLFRIFFGII
jgi:RNA polymerase sigma-70 factor (ECF subfamily)